MRTTVPEPMTRTLDACPADAPLALGPAAAALLVALAPAGLPAQDRPPAPTLSADRPGAGTGAYAVAPGVVQLEGGVEYAESAGSDRYTLGQGLLRFGLPAVELRAGLNSYVVERNGRDTEGFEDLSAGVKVPLTGGAGFRAAALGEVSLPTGAEAYTADAATYSAAALADVALGGAVSVSLNAGFSARFDGGGETASVSVTPSWSPPGAEGVGLYAGYAGSYADGPDRNLAEAGLTVLVNPDTQLDLNGGYEVESQDYFLGLGLAYRLP